MLQLIILRRNLSSFFTWLEDENYIYKSPFRRIHKIKTTISVKDIYADEDLEKLRDVKVSYMLRSVDAEAEHFVLAIKVVSFAESKK